MIHAQIQLQPHSALRSIAMLGPPLGTICLDGWPHRLGNMGRCEALVYRIGRRLGNVGMSGSVYLQGLAAHLGKHKVSGGARLQGLAARLGKHMVFGCVCPQMSRICPLSEVAPVGEIARKP